MAKTSKKKERKEFVPSEEVKQARMNGYRNLVAAYLTMNKLTMTVSTENDKLLYKYLYNEYPENELRLTSNDNTTLKPTKAQTNVKSFESVYFIIFGYSITEKLEELKKKKETPTE